MAVMSAYDFERYGLKLWRIKRIIFFGLPQRMEVHHHAKRE